MPRCAGRQALKQVRFPFAARRGNCFFDPSGKGGVTTRTAVAKEHPFVFWTARPAPKSKGKHHDKDITTDESESTNLPDPNSGTGMA